MDTNLYSPNMDVCDIDDAIVILREITRDLDGFGWLDVCSSDMYGLQIKAAVEIAINWILNHKFQIIDKQLDGTWEVNFDE